MIYIRAPDSCKLPHKRKDPTTRVPGNPPGLGPCSQNVGSSYLCAVLGPYSTQGYALEMVLDLGLSLCWKWLAGESQEWVRTSFPHEPESLDSGPVLRVDIGAAES